jgi:phage repressor protein C with HTH and peptisase S24 domain
MLDTPNVNVKPIERYLFENVQMTLQERINSLFTDQPSKTNADLARFVGCSRATVTDWRNGKTKKIEGANAYKVASFFAADPEWVQTGKGEPYKKIIFLSTKVIDWHSDDKIPEGFIAIPKWKVSFSAGNGHTLSYEIIEEGQPAIYRNDWFQREHINPKTAKRFEVVGDSMEPFLFPGDTILVDTSDTDINRILDGRVYAIRYGDELRIKRLFRKLDGTIVLRSDNSSYQDENVAPELVSEHIALIGRVRDRSGGGGL